jgi:hypothetical protein
MGMEQARRRCNMSLREWASGCLIAYPLPTARSMAYGITGPVHRGKCVTPFLSAHAELLIGTKPFRSARHGDS